MSCLFPDKLRALKDGKTWQSISPDLCCVLTQASAGFHARFLLCAGRRPWCRRSGLSQTAGFLSWASAPTFPLMTLWSEHGRMETGVRGGGGGWGWYRHDIKPDFISCLSVHCVPWWNITKYIYSSIIFKWYFEAHEYFKFLLIYTTIIWYFTLPNLRSVSNFELFPVCLKCSFY